MRNQIFFTIDSLRYDVFEDANCSFLKQFPYEKAWGHGTYTLPAHTSFFAGKLPCTYEGRFDTCARSGRKIHGTPQWRLNNPETPGPAKFQLVGKNIIDGFNKLGYNTYGSGGVGWFDPNKPAHIKEIDSFTEYQWFGQFTYSAQQLDWAIQKIKESNKLYFLFINFGLTHHPFIVSNNDQRTEYGNFRQCFNAQKRCLEYLDKLLQSFFDNINVRNTDLIICSDHGEAMGEDGLWGHGFYHPTIIQVPIIQGKF